MISILIPTLGRAYKIPSVIENIQRHTLLDHEIIFIYELDDVDTVAFVAEAANFTPEPPSVRYANNYHKKNYAGAIQTGYNHAIGSHIFIGADDLDFHHEWDHEAIRTMNALPHIKVVGTNDLFYTLTDPLRLSTHHLVDRTYIENPGGVIDGGPGSIYYFGYRHYAVDTEFIDTAISRAVYSPCPTSVVEHLHYTAGKAPIDSTYAAVQPTWQGDSMIYSERQKLWAS